MATAGGSPAADPGSRRLLRLVSFCVLLAGEAFPARELRRVRRTVRIGRAAGAAVPLLVPSAPGSPHPVNPLSLSFPRQKFPLLPGLDLRVPSPPRHIVSPFPPPASSWTSSLARPLCPAASFSPRPQPPHPLVRKDRCQFHLPCA